MTFVKNILTPIITLTLITIIVGWIIFIVYYIFRKSFKNIGFWIKYKLFKKQYLEEEVRFIMSAYEKGYTSKNLKRFLLLQGFNLKRIDKFLYIYKEMKKVRK